MTTNLSLPRFNYWIWSSEEDIEAKGDLTNDALIQLTNNSGVALTTDNP